MILPVYLTSFFSFSQEQVSISIVSGACILSFKTLSVIYPTRIPDPIAKTILTTVNCHFLKEEGVSEFNGIRINNLDAFPLVAKYFKDKLNDMVLIAPDKGSLDTVKNASTTLGCEFDFLEKERISSEEVNIKAKSLDVKDKDILILDDMISTGATTMEAAKFL